MAYNTEFDAEHSRLRGPGWTLTLDMDNADDRVEAEILTRLAALLTADDERIAHAGHFDRAWAEWADHASASPHAAWDAWWEAISARRPASALDALETAYREARATPGEPTESPGHTP